ncbi:PTS sugar transporter subunit IIA [Enterococcus pallens]|uniref:Mannitol-specific phosphotransferase enzyme IIA component n=1 Tax=Enterococcus pallens ATCC BAA-351 TaxID=1158607 RepID=R2TCQ9_9ENTE|nr:PTS sugar transporter subunit IIA [Enterococcus pallens]EOH97974.1 PTS system mannitol-specific transporter subunit IIA [Enterococcus pallens ATCC BAA-351]EOU20607.1 PTS system mannitol-specific transporter subunit IIA [Enterococcus pallens ATCC BAA-351]OJG80367.1 PTS system mannitol-specific transporter subunit IIA [Enterococcus pallens]
MDLQPEMILLDQSFADKEEAIRACGRLLVENGCVDEAYIEAMIERNQLVSTYMGNFIAIPHGTDEAKRFVKKSGISIVQAPNGVQFGNDDTEDVAMVLFGIAGVENEHLDLLQKIAIFCSDVENVVKLADAQTKEEIIGYLQEVE